MAEKTVDQEVIPSSPISDPTIKRGTGDEALDFLAANAHEENFSHDEVRMRRLRRKIDIRVIPFMALSYLMNFLDKIILNFANVMGLSVDLNLQGNDYSNASSAFWIAVIVAVIPSIYLLQRSPVSKWLAGCLTGWAIATTCTAAASSFEGLLAARVFSGIFEAGIPPSLMLLSSQFYTKQEQVLRFLYWYLGTAGGMIIGGLLSFAFQHVGEDAALAGWQVLYIVIGLLTLCLGIAVYLFVPDTPMEATFLTASEKVSLLEHVKINQTGVENKKDFSWAQVKEGVTDFQLWCQWLIMLLEGGGGGVITTYSATLIRGFGYTSRESALLSMGNGAVAICFCLISSFGVRYFGNRWLFLIFLTCPSIIGSACMAYLPKDNKSGLLSGIFLVYSIFGAVPIQFSWVTANVAGHTKKSFATTTLNAAFAVGNIIGPQTFQAHDAPDFIPAKSAMMAFQCVIIALCVVLYVYFRMENARRDKKSAAAGPDITDKDAFAGLTDKQNPHFRYVY